MTGTMIRLVGIVGSLRRASYNRALLRATRELAPAGTTIDELDIGVLPHYNEDLQALGDPEPVHALKERIREADGLLIVTPEYNHSVPGVLKNAIDWIARPTAASPLRRKPTGILGATTGNFGTLRAQLALRQILQYTESDVIQLPEVLIGQAGDRFDDSGRLVHEPTRSVVAGYLTLLVDRIGRAR